MVMPKLSSTNIGSVKSPLRYPGGKSRAVDVILGFIPDDVERLVSPFLGGGSVELALAARGVRVFGYDAFQPLVNFWECVLHDAALVADRVNNYYPLNHSQFYQLQRRHSCIVDAFESAAVFFVLNRASFSGTTLSGGMSPNHPRFTVSAIERLRQFSSPYLSVSIADYKDSLADVADDFVYCDPPYLIPQRLYGRQGDMHSSFDHIGLAEILNRRENWVLSYNDCPEVRDMYTGCCITPVEWVYGMNNSRRPSNEVIIVHTNLKRVV